MKIISQFCAIMILIGSCSSVPVRSLPKLNSIDPQSTDIGQARLLYKYPSEIKVQGERLKCEVEAKFDGDETRKISVKMVLSGSDRTDQAMAAKLAEDGYRVEVLRISPAQVAELDDMREWVIAKREDGVKGEGSLSCRLSLENVCIQDAPKRKLVGNVYVKTSETREYVHALRNVDILEELEDAEQELKPCS